MEAGVLDKGVPFVDSQNFGDGDIRIGLVVQTQMPNFIQNQTSHDLLKNENENMVKAQVSRLNSGPHHQSAEARSPRVRLFSS